MDLTAFRDSLKDSTPPAGHEQGAAGTMARCQRRLGSCPHAGPGYTRSGRRWVHAYLHRVEGDESNAGYWYGRAEKPHCQTSLEEEWVEIATALLGA